MLNQHITNLKNIYRCLPSELCLLAKQIILLCHKKTIPVFLCFLLLFMLVFEPSPKSYINFLANSEHGSLPFFTVSSAFANDNDTGDDDDDEDDDNGDNGDNDDEDDDNEDDDYEDYDYKENLGYDSQKIIGIPPAIVAVLPSDNDNHYEPDIILALNIDDAGFREALRGSRLQHERAVSLPELNLTLTRFRIKSGWSVHETLKRLKKTDSEALFSANHYYRLADTKQQGKDIRHFPLDKINWTTDKELGKGIRIGMIDTPVNTRASFLPEKQITTHSFVRNNKQANQEHGTAVASLLVGKPDSDFPGLLPATKLYAASVFHINSDGQVIATAEAIGEALNWLQSKDISVINMSLSGPNNIILERIIKQALKQNTVIVAAAGNDGPNGQRAYPAATKGVLAITAVDRFLRPYRQANRGGYINFAAPGVGIWVPGLYPKGQFSSGTSFAAAYFTAMAARKLQDPGVRPGHEHLQLIFSQQALDLGSPGKDSTYGWGLVRWQ